MLYDILLLITAFMFCLSLLLVHNVAVLENDFHNLRRDINLPLNLSRIEQVSGEMAKMTEKRKSRTAQNPQNRLKMSFNRLKREQGSYRAPASFLQLTANGSKQPDRRGDIAIIPWTVSVQQGNAISHRENRIVVQEDGFYLVFGQVLFESPGTVMGHIIQSWGHAGAAETSLELLRCLQEMPVKTPANTCYTTGVVQLHQGDELELVILCSLQILVSMDADSTFFGVIRLN